MRKRPHIIIFNPDEMRYDTMGHMGNPAAVTPFLDEFAAGEAVSFRRAFCQNTVCVPSRCSFFTGLYPHVHGHRTMNYLLRPGEDNLFSELKKEGYHIWMNDRNDLFAGQIAGWAKSNADEIFYGGNVPKAPEPVKPEHFGGGKEDLYSHYGGKLGLDENGRNYNPDDEAVDAAIARIKSYKGDQPLCIFLGLMYPHVPYQTEEPYYSAIDRSKLPERIKPEECSGKAEMLGQIRKYQDMDHFTEEDWDEIRAVYLGMCSKVDAQFRRLCDGLKQAGIYNDSAVFFFSDHGDFTGDYGVTEKAQSTMEDCLTRVPLLIKPPEWEKVDSGITDSLVELVDFYATAADYCQIMPKRTHFGRSLRPVIENRSKKVREYVVCEGGRLPEEEHCDEYHAAVPSENFVYWPKMMAQTDGFAHAKAAMIRSAEYKFISRITGEDEFYDLKNDPGERINHISNPEYAAEINSMRTEMLRWYQKTCDVVPYEYDRRFTDDMLWAKVKNICPPDRESQVKEMIKQGIDIGKLLQYVKGLEQGDK
ncbi:sulfatase-like hydrolase/transferase [Clostridium sp. MCC353]|uniref:sulfatase-like hydrolase/transferase n=1 Tax=Clostridium sp. MCC353 TaxID=2592646 RepID=UPI001C02F35A|nr:sulfatase-like hydrolase/transferase [Clostridium sp. MCC353]MBT9778726.1 sulfatase-like hydrolase/transferase [Clostridium sp. MCC353]